MRIAFLGPASSPHATRWVEHFRARGHDVQLATLHVIPAGAPKGAFPLAGRLAEHQTPWWLMPQAVSRARRWLTAFRPDVTIAYYMTSYGLLAALSGIRPWIGAAAGGDVLVDAFDGPLRRTRNRLILGFALRRAKAMLAWAPHVADRLVALGFARERILVQARGVDRSEFPFREPRRRGPGDALRVVSLRWLKPLYRVDTLIDALVLAARAGVPIEARIAGDGPLRGDLERRAAAAGLASRVRFAGAVSPRQVPELLAWSDVYVSTSSTDGASASLFEALAVGTFPIVTDIPANRGWIAPGRTGELFPTGDVAALADRLAALAADDDRRVAGILAARDDVAERLDYHRNMARIEEYVAQVAGVAPPAAPRPKGRQPAPTPREAADRRP